MRPRPRTTTGFLAICVLSALVVVPVDAKGEQGAAQGVGPVAVNPVAASPSPEPETYGTASQAVMIVGSFMFQGELAGTTIQKASGVDRYINSGGWAVAHPVLPNGAVVEKIELRACDTSPSDVVQLFFYYCGTPGGSCTGGESVTTGGAATPGCGNFALTLVSPVQVNNQNPLAVMVGTGATNTTTFSAVKLYYRLQVSPAPGVASFTDVPTNYWAFQYIEALKASGITLGVTPTTYEPESNVTRAQMAVFLAKALGLHWPN